jgi:hypothetical protein
MKNLKQFVKSLLAASVQRAIRSTPKRERAISRAGLEAFEPRLLFSTGSLENFTWTPTTVTWCGATGSAYSGIYVVQTTGNQDFETLASGWGLPAQNVTDLGGNGFYAFCSTVSSSTVASWISTYSSDLQSLAPDYVESADPDTTTIDSNELALSRMDMNSAWQVTTGSQLGGGVVVAILGNGFNTSASDFTGNIWTNWGEKPNNASDDDGDQLVNDIHGWNFYVPDGDNDPSENPTEHGTIVAMSAGANGSDNDMHGTAPNVQLLPVQTGDIPSDDAFIRAMIYIVRLKEKYLANNQTGANIVAADCPFPTMSDPFAKSNVGIYNEISALDDAGIFLVCSAAPATNLELAPNNGFATFPSGFGSSSAMAGVGLPSLDNVISVGSTLYDPNYGGEAFYPGSAYNGSNTD